MGELEIDGPEAIVSKWWERLWPEISQPVMTMQGAVPTSGTRAAGSNTTQIAEVFGEYYTEFRPDITDADKVLIAAVYVQGRDQDRVFSTKAANQALLDQNIKVTNASENVRRLIQTKRAFVVSDGKYRVSTIGLDHLNTLKVTN
jgi:hypothetical protein